MSTSKVERHHMLRIFRWLVVGAAALVILALAVGGCYELVARHRAASNFPPPGKLVDVGGRKIQLDCRGSSAPGSPTVVLEAGLDANGSLAWSAVHDSIAATTRTCAYSRAGIMWSNPAPGAFDVRRNAADLHTALLKAGEHAPWIMVGHSLGGPYIMSFTQLYQAEVKGLVFVDASHPDQVKRMRAIRPPMVDQSMRVPELMAAMEWTGFMRLMRRPTPPRWPVVMRSAPPAYFPTSFPAVLSEQEALDSTLAFAGRVRTLGDRPLVVLTATKPYSAEMRKQIGLTQAQSDRMQALWKALHDDEASWSSHSRHELVPNATHYIQFDRPDVVIRAVREVISDVR